MPYKVIPGKNKRNSYRITRCTYTDISSKLILTYTLVEKNKTYTKFELELQIRRLLPTVEPCSMMWCHSRWACVRSSCQSVGYDLWDRTHYLCWSTFIHKSGPSPSRVYCTFAKSTNSNFRFPYCSSHGRVTFLKHCYWLVGQKYNTHVTAKDQIYE
jgi:hypothetical protein